MTYTVYFEIFGKKMRHDVEATSEADAKRKVAEKIVYHKVVERLSDKDIADMFYDFLGIYILKRKK